MFGGEPVLSGEAFAEASPGVSEPSGAFQTSVSSIAFAAAGLEPVADIWHIPSLQDDIEHLQDMAFRLAFELAEALEIGELVIEDKSPLSSGFRIIDEPMYSAHSGRQLLSSFLPTAPRWRHLHSLCWSWERLKWGRTSAGRYRGSEIFPPDTDPAPPA